MSTQQAKRRRLNEATKTLHRPFKSPFRAPLDPSTSSDTPSSDPPEPQTPVNTNLSRSSTSLTPIIVKPHLRSTHAPGSGIHTPSSSLRKKTTPKPSLTREIMRERNDIQTLTHAHTLATSSKDADLEILIDKWRTASRAAAEELFASTRDRVNRMGGVGAWKEREREQSERRKRWDREELEIERERLHEEMDNGEHENELYDNYTDLGREEDDQEEEDSKGADGDSFTMDMMLKALNINYKLIGYNKEAQRWDG